MWSTWAEPQTEKFNWLRNWNLFFPRKTKENLPKSPNFIWIRISGESVVILNLDIFFLLQIFKEGNAVITNKSFQIWLTALFRFTKDKTKYPINLHWLLESYLQFRVSSPIPNPRMGVIDFFLFLEVKFRTRFPNLTCYVNKNTKQTSYIWL